MFKQVRLIGSPNKTHQTSIKQLFGPSNCTESHSTGRTLSEFWIVFGLVCLIHFKLIWLIWPPPSPHSVCSAAGGAITRTKARPRLFFAVLCDHVCLLSQVDVTKCVVNTDLSFHSHWLVSAVCTFGHYLKSLVLHLLREKWCSSNSESLLWMMFTLICTEP